MAKMGILVLITILQILTMYGVNADGPVVQSRMAYTWEPSFYFLKGDEKPGSTRFNLHGLWHRGEGVFNLDHVLSFNIDEFDGDLYDDLSKNWVPLEIDKKGAPKSFQKQQTEKRKAELRKIRLHEWWKREWETHGAHYMHNEGLNTPDGYFRSVMRLHHNLRVNEHVGLKLEMYASNTAPVDYKKLLAVLRGIWKNGVEIDCKQAGESRHPVKMNDFVLFELRFHYDQYLKLMNLQTYSTTCKSDKIWFLQRNPDDTPVNVADEANLVELTEKVKLDDNAEFEQMHESKVKMDVVPGVAMKADIDEKMIQAEVAAAAAAAAAEQDVAAMEQDYNPESSYLLTKVLSKRKMFHKKRRLAVEVLAKGVTSNKDMVQAIFDEEVPLATELNAIDSDWAHQAPGHYTNALKRLLDNYESLLTRLGEETERCLAETRKMHKAQRVTGEQVRLERKKVEVELDGFITEVDEWRKAKGYLMELTDKASFRDQFQQLTQRLQENANTLSYQKYGEPDQERLKTDFENTKAIAVQLAEDKNNFPTFQHELQMEIVGDTSIAMVHFPAMMKLALAQEHIAELDTPEYGSKSAEATVVIARIKKKIEECNVFLPQIHLAATFNQMVDAVFTDLRALRMLKYQSIPKKRRPNPRQLVVTKMEEDAQYCDNIIEDIRAKDLPAQVFAQHGQWKDHTTRLVLIYWNMHQQVMPAAEAGLVAYTTELEAMRNSISNLNHNDVIDYLIKVQSQSEFSMMVMTRTLVYVQQLYGAFFENIDNMREPWINRTDELLVKTQQCNRWANDDKLDARLKRRTTEAGYEQWKDHVQKIRESEPRILQIKHEMQTATTMAKLTSYSADMHILLRDVTLAYGKMEELLNEVNKKK